MANIQFGDDQEPVRGRSNHTMVDDGELQDPMSKVEALLEDLGPEGMQVLLEQLKGRVESAVAEPQEEDPIERGNRLRLEAAAELSQLHWWGSGTRFPLMLSVGRYSAYETLRRWKHGQVTEEEAFDTRYWNSGMLLFLCATQVIESVPIHTLIQMAAEWQAKHIPVEKRDEALWLANRILDLTDLFVPVVRGDGVEDEGDEPQKKTPAQEARPGTSPSSARA